MIDLLFVLVVVRVSCSCEQGVGENDHVLIVLLSLVVV
jgi:hypothetical protein